MNDPDPLARAKVVLGVTGGIAAYKAVELCRRLVDAGAHVVPVMTRSATRFVGEVTFSALASEPVRMSMWEEDDPIPHTRLGQGADVVVVAPATARFIGAYAAGICSDLLSATVLATRAPVLVCPAMHTEMWENPAVQENLATLARRGTHVVAPGEGRLAGGDVGMGRLAAVEEILEATRTVLGRKQRDLEGRSVLVSAGGTREPIDPVRFITNRSSGKQGHAIAAEALRRGAKVVLVTASSLPAPPGVRVIPVTSAAQMEKAMLAETAGADIVVMAAAVADFRVKEPSSVKLKKAEGPPHLVLEPTPDILSELAAMRRPGQVLVGFAAETEQVAERASAKLRAKGVDIMVANDVSAPGVGFEHDTNAVTILEASGERHEVALSTKQGVARALLDIVVGYFEPGARESTR